MRRINLACLTPLILLIISTAPVYGQRLPVKWEELTASDFARAVKQGQNTCVLPFGIIEKHGPQLPLGTDLINSRYAAVHGAEQEYAVVFPEYYFGQIFEGQAGAGDRCIQPASAARATARDDRRNGS